MTSIRYLFDISANIIICHLSFCLYSKDSGLNISTCPVTVSQFLFCFQVTNYENIGNIGEEGKSTFYSHMQNFSSIKIRDEDFLLLYLESP